LDTADLRQGEMHQASLVRIQRTQETLLAAGLHLLGGAQRDLQNLLLAQLAESSAIDLDLLALAAAIDDPVEQVLQGAQTLALAAEEVVAIRPGEIELDRVPVIARARPDVETETAEDALRQTLHLGRVGRWRVLLRLRAGPARPLVDHRGSSQRAAARAAPGS